MAEAVVASVVAKEVPEVKVVLQEMEAVVVVTGTTGKVAQLAVEMVSILGAIGNQKHHPLSLYPSQQQRYLLHPLPQLRRQQSARRHPFLHHPLPLSLSQRRHILGPIGQHPVHHPSHHHHLQLLLPQLRLSLQRLTFLLHQLPRLLIGLIGPPWNQCQFQLLQLFLSPRLLLPCGKIGPRHLLSQFQLQLRPLLIIGRTGVAHHPCQ